MAIHTQDINTYIYFKYHNLYVSLYILFIYIYIIHILTFILIIHLVRVQNQSQMLQLVLSQRLDKLSKRIASPS